MIEASQVREYLIVGMSELAARTADLAADNFHLQLAELRYMAQEAIDRGDSSRAARCFELACELLEVGSPEVKNAVAVSFLEGLRFSGPLAASSRIVVPEKLRAAMDDLDGYMSQLLGELWVKESRARNWPAV
jgi:hypothetical protein